MEENKILIVCDGREILIKTKRTAIYLAELFAINEKEAFMEIDKEVFIRPDKVTWIQNINTRPLFNKS